MNGKGGLSNTEGPPFLQLQHQIQVVKLDAWILTFNFL